EKPRKCKSGLTSFPKDPSEIIYTYFIFNNPPRRILFSNEHSGLNLLKEKTLFKRKGLKKRGFGNFFLACPKAIDVAGRLRDPNYLK
ncbi:MAG: hypothetical protein KJ666_07440, partial [Bacteroidetes bacterium]|nr:hypothetical protein [Bacteroidota bacterium]